MAFAFELVFLFFFEVFEENKYEKTPTVNTRSSSLLFSR